MLSCIHLVDIMSHCLSLSKLCCIAIGDNCKGLKVNGAKPASIVPHQEFDMPHNPLLKSWDVTLLILVRYSRFDTRNNQVQV